MTGNARFHNYHQDFIIFRVKMNVSDSSIIMDYIVFNGELHDNS